LKTINDIVDLCLSFRANAMFTAEASASRMPNLMLSPLLFKFFTPGQIKRYYSFKVKHHDMYYGLMPSKEENVFKANVLTVFPNRDQLGRRILLLELGSKFGFITS
jgi:hypothetical protein